MVPTARHCGKIKAVTAAAGQSQSAERHLLAVHSGYLLSPKPPHYLRRRRGHEHLPPPPRPGRSWLWTPSRPPAPWAPTPAAPWVAEVLASYPDTKIDEGMAHWEGNWARGVC